MCEFWAIINNILAAWGLLSLICFILSFFINSFEDKSGVHIITNPDSNPSNELHTIKEYQIETNSHERTLIYCNEYPLKNIKIYEFIDEKNKWTKGKKIIDTLPPDNGILLYIDRPEGFAKHKISWQINYGAKTEYIFEYNGATGNYNTATRKYYYNITSKLRRIFKVK